MLTPVVAVPLYDIVHHSTVDLAEVYLAKIQTKSLSLTSLTLNKTPKNNQSNITAILLNIARYLPRPYARIE